MVTEWHIITGEYPPQPGGVGDYTRLVASGLAAAGDVVHIWCPSHDGASPRDSGVIVHRELGSMTPRDLFRAGRMLNEFPGPRRILVQWVPHAFGFRSANVPVSLWIALRALLHRDHVEIMLHEAYLSLRQNRLKHLALAIAHRIMLTALLGVTRRVWMAIPKWEEYCRLYTLGRSIPFTWLPVVSNIPVIDEPGRTESIRSRYASSSELLIGHFGTCGGAIGEALREIIPSLLKEERRSILLIGNDSLDARDLLLRDHPQLHNRIHATGRLTDADVSLHLAACDLMVQPYPDGVSSRRGGLMAALAHGKAIVGTSGHLTEPVWHDGAPVMLVPAGKHAEFITEAERLLADEGRRRSLAAASKTMYDRRFALTRLIETLRQDVESGGKHERLRMQARQGAAIRR